MVDEHIAKLPIPEQEKHREIVANNLDDHPGCLLAGFLLVNRVPGNFHIQARSKHHNLNPAMANLSHVVNELSFGPMLTKAMVRRLDDLNKEYFDKTSIEPINGIAYRNTALHQAYHHYIKVCHSFPDISPCLSFVSIIQVVSTHIEAGARYSGKDAILVYQMVHSAQVMQVLFQH
jgi:hypothetical protein